MELVQSKRMSLPSPARIAIGLGVLLEVAALAQLLFDPHGKPPLPFLLFGSGIILVGVSLLRPSLWPRLLAGAFLVVSVWATIRKW